MPISKRSDVSEADKKAAVKQYGDVEYADAKNKKYPIDTSEHIRAAWNYINKPKNAGKYRSGEVQTIKRKIVSAWKSKIGEDSAPSLKKEFAMIPVKDFIVFRAGDYPQGTFTEDDLDEIVQAYSESNHAAPVTVGHVSDYPDSRAPRFGMIGSLRRVGKDLIATSVELAEELLDWINDGYYSDRSIALYGRNDSSNPSPGKLNVHHLAILGGQPPQVKGMPELAFSSQDKFTEIALNFDEADIEAIVGMAADDTIEAISEEFAECLKMIEAVVAEAEDDEDDEEDMQECLNVLWECQIEACNIIRRHYDFLEKSDSIADRFMEKVAQMKEKVKGLIHITQSRKESDMEGQVLKEFRESQAKVKQLEATILSFAEEKKALEAKAAETAKAAEDQKKKDRDARVDAQMKEFREELIKGNYPVKKLEDEGVFALAKQLLTANELEFGEGKKKAPMQILKGIIENTGKVNTSVQFTEDPGLVSVADVIGVDRSLPVDRAGLMKIQFCEQYYQKNLEEFKGVEHKVALARILSRVQSGKIKYAGN